MKLNEVLNGLEIDPKDISVLNLKERNYPHIMWSGDHSYFAKGTSDYEEFEMMCNNKDWKYEISIKRYK